MQTIKHLTGAEKIWALICIYLYHQPVSCFLGLRTNKLKNEDKCYVIICIEKKTFVLFIIAVIRYIKNWKIDVNVFWYTTITYTLGTKMFSVHMGIILDILENPFCFKQSHKKRKNSLEVVWIKHYLWPNLSSRRY